MDTKVLFDSKSYIRKIPVHFSLFDSSKDIIKKDTLELNRMVIIETEKYKINHIYTYSFGRTLPKQGEVSKDYVDWLLSNKEG